MSTLYVNGTIHSTSDPYATALLVTDGSIAWVGADDTAESMRARSGADWEVVDLDDALVVPAFVDSLSLTAAPAAETAAGAGIFLSATATGTPGQGADPRALGYRLLTADVADAAAGDPEHLLALSTDGAVGIAVAVGTDGVEAGGLGRLVSAATRAGLQAYLLPEREEDLAATVQALRATAAEQGAAALGRVRHRISWNGPVDEAAILTLAENSVSVTVVPDADGTLHAPVATLLNRAVPVAFGSGTAAPNPWAAVRASLEHPDPEQRISARSGFTATTRAGLRTLPMSVAAGLGMAGRLAPAAPATFGIWATEALSVQAPDGRVAAWSTDTRAGTPLLPVLEEGTAAPVCLATVVDGVTVHRVDGQPA